MFTVVTHFALHLDLITSLSSRNEKEMETVTSLSVSVWTDLAARSFIHNRAAGSVPCETSNTFLAIRVRRTHMHKLQHGRVPLRKLLLIFVI